MQRGYRWAASGDINAFFGLLLDNIAGLVLIVGLLNGIFGIPIEFILSRMIPGTAIGVFVGDLLYFGLAFLLARSSGKSDVTAMPLGLDTPSIFGISIFVVGAAYRNAISSGLGPDEAAMTAWQIGICVMFYSGIFKSICAVGGSWVRKILPRAGLFGSLVSIALVIISFLPLVDVMKEPIVGLVALAIVLTTLVGQVPLPFKMPGTVAALIVAGAIHYIQLYLTQQPLLAGAEAISGTFFPTAWLEATGFGWWSQMGAAVNYLPIAIPFALATVVGGIDCTESAVAVGDEYSTMHVLGVEAIATLVAAICGGITQTTPYIGHPAYKTMGARAAYTLATAFAIGALGLVGGFHYFYLLIPKAAVFPILIFIGLEITAQSFVATPKRHYPAIALACVPALAFLAFFYADQILGAAGIESVKMQDLRESLQTVQLLSHGFVVSSLLWSSMLAMAIDRRLKAAACFAAIAAVCTLFGVIHSPLSNNALFMPFPVFGSPEQWVLPAELQLPMWKLVLGYIATALLFFVWAIYLKQTKQDQIEIAAE